jgi:hypothetical protein
MGQDSGTFRNIFKQNGLQRKKGESLESSLRICHSSQVIFCRQTSLQAYPATRARHRALGFLVPLKYM